MRIFSAPASGSLAEGSAQARRWRLSPDAFERLLAALNSDRERAAVAYEQLRHRIIGLLRWWGRHNRRNSRTKRLIALLGNWTAREAARLAALSRGVA